MKKIAVIDLGTNGFRLYIAEVWQQGHFHVFHKESNDLKLASEGIHRIGQAPFERGLAAMRHFAHVLQKYEVSQVRAFGTAALRLADNGLIFIERVKKETGIEIELISGAREAELIYKGMKLGIPLSHEPVLMIDIGGGSVEFIIGNQEKVFWAHSFNVGVAILKHQFHQNDPIGADEILEINTFLNKSLSELLDKIQEFKPKIPIIACGTLDFMVKILSRSRQGDAEYPQEGYGNKLYFEIDKPAYNYFRDQWLAMSEKALFVQPDIPKEKIEMLAVSLVLIDWILRQLEASQLIASANSMKAGILYEMSLRSTETISEI